MFYLGFAATLVFAMLANVMFFHIREKLSGYGQDRSPDFVTASDIFHLVHHYGVKARLHGWSLWPARIFWGTATAAGVTFVLMLLLVLLRGF